MANWEVEILPSDFNADGKTDILTKNYHHFRDKYTLVPFPNVNYFNDLYISTGHQFSNPEDLIAHDLDFSQVFDNNFDGTPDLYYAMGTVESDDYSITFHKNDLRSLIKEITNSSNISAKFSYELPAGSNIYSHEPEVITFPVQHLVLPTRIVSRLEVIDRNLSKTISDTRLNYTNFKIQRQGKGSLGFSSVSSENFISGDKTIAYNKYHPTLYLPYIWKSEGLKNDILITEGINEYTYIPFDNNRRYYTYVSRTISNNMVDYISQEINIASDNNGNITQRIIKYLNSTSVAIKTVTENMSNFNNFGLPGNISVISSADGSTIQRDNIIVYNPNGLVVSATSLFGASPSLVTSFTYDGFGNKLSETTNTGSVTRTKSFLYETTMARFVIRSTDQFGQNTEYTYDPVTSSLIKETDFTNLITSYRYDNLGRLTRVSYPDSTSQRFTWSWSNDALVDGISELYATKTTTSGKPTVIRYFDRSGKELRSKTTSFDGRFIVSDTEYDNHGRVITKYAPYFEMDGRSSQKTNYEYKDTLGRISKVTVLPSSDSTTYTYTPLKISVTKAGRPYETEMDASGQKIRTTEPGGSIYYHYNPEGKTDRIESPSGATMIEYDDYGNQNKLIDIDAGTIIYKYNGIGELLEQTDAKGNKITYIFNSSGRLTSESWNTGLVKNYEYNAVNSKISRIYTSEGTELGYTYDNFIRIVSVTQKADQQNVFTKDYTYNSFGDIETIITNSTVTERNTYNQYGYHDKVLVNDFLVWQAFSQNKYGIIDNFKLRNNSENTVHSYDEYGFPSGILTTSGNTIQNWTYSFDPVTGNMTSRKGLGSLGNVIEEKFNIYDTQDRLKEYSIGPMVSTINYDLVGKGTILYKTDVGNYGYLNRVHTPDSIINPTTLVSLLPDQLITYTEFNKIKSLTNTIGESAIKNITWAYSPDDERTKQVSTLNGQVTSTKYYAFGNFEKEVTPASTRELYYIDTPSGTIAAIEVKSNQTVYFYIHTDLLGSFDVITNQNGVCVEMNSFDPWGRKRNPLDWSFNNVNHTLLLGRGFTGHEHLPEFDLINMNGRIYDPILAMFLSPDNYVQAPERTQNFNRYAYCLNNPLKFTDPDGENWQQLIGWGLSYLSHQLFPQNYNLSTPEMQNINMFCGILSSGLNLPLPGLLTNGIYTGGTSLLVQGLHNYLTDRPFFEKWGSSFSLGFVSGAIQGYNISKQRSRSSLWGYKVEYEVIADQDIPCVGQRGANNCLAAVASAVDQSMGGTLTQEDIRNWFGGDLENDPIFDKLLWDKFALETGTITNRVDSKQKYFSSIYSTMKDNGRISINMNTGGDVGHGVVMKSIMLKKVPLFNINRFIYVVMNPANNGYYERISRGQIRNAWNIFTIQK